MAHSASQSSAVVARALPESIRSNSQIQEILAQPLLSSGTFKFPNGTTGAFAVSKAPAEWLGGELKDQFQFFVTRGERILESGNLGALRRISGTFEIHIEMHSAEVPEAKVAKGLPRYKIEVTFDEPEKAKLQLRADQLVLVEGPLEVRLSTRGKIEQVSHTFGKRAAPATAPKSVVTLEDYSIQESKVRLTALPTREKYNFSNTLVGLWLHVPEMTPTVREQLDLSLSRRKKAGTLNVLIEAITRDSAGKASLSLRYNKRAQISQNDMHNLGESSVPPEFDTGVLRPLYDGVSEAVIDVAKKHGMKAQFHFVDIEMNKEAGRISSEWDRKYAAWDRFASLRAEKLHDQTPNPREAMLKCAYQCIEQSSKCFSSRESTVVSQMQRFALAPSDDAINLLLVGAGHRPIVTSLAGAKPMYVVLPIEMRSLVSAKTYAQASQVRSHFDWLRTAFENGAKLPEHNVRGFFLEHRIRTSFISELYHRVDNARGSALRWNDAVAFSLHRFATSCLTPPETRSLFLAACDTKKSSSDHSARFIKWCEKKFGLDLRPGRTNLDQLARSMMQVAAATASLTRS